MLAAAEAFGEGYRRKRSNQWRLFRLLLGAWERDPRRILGYDEILSGLGYDASTTLPKPVLEAKARLSQRLESFEQDGIRFRIQNLRSEGYRLVVFRGSRLFWDGHRPHHYVEEAWERGELEVAPRHPRRRRWAAAAVVVPLLALVGGFLLRGLSGDVPASVRLRGDVVEWRDARGGVVRRLTLAELARRDGEGTGLHLNPNVEPEEIVRLADLDGDGRPELLLGLVRTGLGKKQAFVYCLEADGSLRWRARGGGLLRYRDRRGVRFAGEFRPVRVDVGDLEGDGRLEVIVLFEHRTYSPSQVVVLDGGGRVLSSYWHDGHIYAVEAAPAGWAEPSLLLGGVNDSQRAAFVALLPARAGRRASTFRDFDVPPAWPRRDIPYVLFPPSPLARLYEIKPQVRALEFLDGGTLRVTVSEVGLSNDSPPDLYYRFGPGLKPLHYVLTDGMKDQVHRAVRQGILPAGEGNEGRLREEMGSLRTLRDGNIRTAQIVPQAGGLPPPVGEDEHRRPPGPQGVAPPAPAAKPRLDRSAADLPTGRVP